MTYWTRNGKASTSAPISRSRAKPRVRTQAPRLICSIAMLVLAGLTWNQATAGTLPLPLHSSGPIVKPSSLGVRPRFLYGCTINAPNMNFGTYDIFSAAPLAAQDTISISCNYCFGGGNVSLSFSTGASGTYSSRTMSNGTDSLNYNLFADTSHTQILGDGTNGTYTYQTTLNGGFIGTVQGSFTAYGLIPAQQNVSPGTYSDTIAVTLTF